MISEPEWKPCLADKQWFETTVGLLAEGGVLVFPSSMLAYRVSHQNKTLTIVKENITQDYQFLHDRTVRVAKLLGWTVKIL